MIASITTHERFMKEALKEARIALSKEEVPIGAVIVWGDRIIARAHNLTETLNDTTAHAEMQAITAAANHIGGKYLTECTLYVTMEPCIMCGGACYWCQIGEIVYGTADERMGYSSVSTRLLHPKTKVRSGVMEEECRSLVKDFFKSKRQ